MEHVQPSDKLSSIARLQENEERYRTLVDGIFDYAIFFIDSKGRIVSWNPGSEIILGYPRSEAIGSFYSELFPEDAQDHDEPTEHLLHALKEGSFRCECLQRKKNGEVFFADLYIRPSFVKEKLIGYAVVMSNLNEKKKLIEEVHTSKNEVSELIHEKEQREKYISSLSHDLRSPLSSARMSAELIRKDPTKWEMHVTKIIKNIDRTDKMIRDLLDVKKIKAGKELPLNLKHTNLSVILKEVIDSYLLDERNHIKFNIPDNICGMWDEDALKRIFENLISNALKYGDKNYPVTVDLECRDDWAITRVHNMCEAIAPAELVSIFVSYERGQIHSGKKTGWGLGLPLVKGLTESHRGKVSVVSLKKEGTTFTVELPMKPPSDNFQDLC